MDEILPKLTFEFFGTGKHKISPEKVLEMKDCILLDVRSREEAESLSFNLKFYPNVKCINIPVNEMPNRINELSEDKSIAIFCSGSVRASIVYSYLLSKNFSDIKIVVGGYSVLTDALKPGKIFKHIQNNL